MPGWGTEPWGTGSWGSSTAPAGGDGEFPQLLVQMAIGGPTTVDPAASGFVLGVSTLGVSTLGSLAWTDVTADTVSVSTTPGVSGQGQGQTVSPTTFSVVLDNTSGLYDPLENTQSGGLLPSATLHPSATLYPSAAGALVDVFDIDVGQHVRVRASWAGTVYDLVYGYIDDIVPDYGYEPTVTFNCSDGLSLLGRVKVLETVPQFAGDTTGTRIGRILDEAMWPATLRALDAGLATCQDDTYGDFALALIQRVVSSEFGELYVDGAGRVVFTDRMSLYTAPRSATVQATFTDSGADIDMQDLRGAKVRSDLYNQATVTRDGGVEQFYEDALSRNKYGPHTFSGQVGTMLADDGQAQSLARFIVSKFGQPTDRFTDITLEAFTQGMWAQLLPLRRFDLIRTVRDYGPVTIDVDLLVDSIAYAITPTSWQMGIATRSVGAFAPFRLGISKLGSGTLA